MGKVSPVAKSVLLVALLALLFLLLTADPVRSFFGLEDAPLERPLFSGEIPAPDAPATTRPAIRAITPPATPAIPILLYHGVLPEPPKGPIVTEEDFWAQMRALKEAGYEAVDTAELRRILTGEAQGPERPVVITFDDGYESEYLYAYPILKEEGLKAVSFVIGYSIGGKPGDYWHSTWEQMSEMAESGVFEFGYHSWDAHSTREGVPRLIEMDSREIRQDLGRLREAFAKEGVPLQPVYAYPYGVRDGEAVTALRREGILLGFTTEGRLASPEDSLLELPRIGVPQGMTASELLERLESLKAETAANAVAPRKTGT